MNKILNTLGTTLLSLPTTKNNRINNRRRNIYDLEATSAAHMISAVGIDAIEPVLFCGKHNKAIHIVRQLTKKTTRPFVLIGTNRDLGEHSCLRVLDIEWEANSLTRNLPNGNGLLILEPGPKTRLDLMESLFGWESRFVILCVGNGLQIDQELLNILNGIGHYMLLSENLQRSVKSTDGCKMTSGDLLASMEYIIVSSIGTAGKDLIKILPDFEHERITNTTDFSLHHDPSHSYDNGHYNRSGGGFRLSQSKTIESRCIITQEELRNLQDANIMLVHNAHSSHTWVAKITC